MGAAVRPAERARSGAGAEGPAGLRDPPVPARGAVPGHGRSSRVPKCCSGSGRGHGVNEHLCRGDRLRAAAFSLEKRRETLKPLPVPEGA